jgi:anti-anti-sigma regulatory factor
MSESVFPALFLRTDRDAGTVIATLSGALSSCDEIDALRHTLDSVPLGFSLVIELDAMTTLSATSLSCLRELALMATRHGTRLILVSESLDVRANLILADLDSLAPVLHNLAQAGRVIAAAA